MRNINKGYLKAKFEEHENTHNIKNINVFYRGISDFKKGYQPIKDERGALFADSHSILSRWRKYFSRLFGVHGFNDVRQMEIHTAEPLVPEPSALRLGWL